jgi:hypothetical protein
VSFKKDESGALSEIEPVIVSTVCVSTTTTGVNPPDGRMRGWEPDVLTSLKYPGHEKPDGHGMGNTLPVGAQ